MSSQDFRNDLGAIASINPKIASMLSEHIEHYEQCERRANQIDESGHEINRLKRELETTRLTDSVLKWKLRDVISLLKLAKFQNGDLQKRAQTFIHENDKI